MARASKPPRRSAGVALVRPGPHGGWELLLVHPGGPFWRNKDEHAWSIPKGEIDPESDTGRADPPPAEELEATARREFAEEIGSPVPDGDLTPLAELNLGSGKRLHAFLARGDLDPTTVVSNTFELEWPPRSGRTRAFPEVDRAAWYPLDAARTRLHKGQVGLVDLVTAALQPG